MSDYTERQRSKWQRVAQTWYAARPPAIPSAQDLTAFATALTETRCRSAVAVLGCTPTLRALTRELPEVSECRLLVIDFLREMYSASTAFCTHNTRDEQFVCADWCATGIAEQCLDAVLGDKALDNVHPSRWRPF